MGSILSFVVFSKTPKVMVFFFLVFSKTPWLWFSSSWPKPQSYDILLHGFFQSSQNCGFFLRSFFFQNSWLWSSYSWPKLQSCCLVLHGFFQSSQNHFLLRSRTFKFMVFFFLDFSKAPKVPKDMLLLFLVIFQNSMAMLFFFLVETSNLCFFFSWFFPKFPK